MPGNLTDCSCDITIDPSSNNISWGTWLSVAGNIALAVVSAGLAFRLTTIRESQKHKLSSYNKIIHSPDGTTTEERRVEAEIDASGSKKTFEAVLNTKNESSSRPTSGEKAAPESPLPDLGMPKTAKEHAVAIGAIYDAVTGATNNPSEAARVAATKAAMIMVATPSAALAALEASHAESKTPADHDHVAISVTGAGALPVPHDTGIHWDVAGATPSHADGQ